MTQASTYTWRIQHLIDMWRMPGIAKTDHVELVAARNVIDWQPAGAEHVRRMDLEMVERQPQH